MLRHELVTRPGQGRRPAPDPGHRHPAQRQGGGVPQPAGAAGARTWPPWTSNRSRAGSGSPAISCSAAARDIRSYLDESTPFPRGPAEPGTALPAVPGLQGTVRRRARSTPARPSGTPTAASCGSGSGTGRRWRCCARWPPRRGPRPPPCAPGPRTSTPQDVAEADRLGRSAVLDLPDEETVESADATPGADGDDRGGRHGAPQAAASASPTGPTSWKAAADTKLALLGRGGHRAAARRLQPDRVLPVHRHRRIRRRAPGQAPGPRATRSPRSPACCRPTSARPGSGT